MAIHAACLLILLRHHMLFNLHLAPAYTFQSDKPAAARKNPWQFT